MNLVPVCLLRTAIWQRSRFRKEGGSGGFFISSERTLDELIDIGPDG